MRTLLCLWVGLCFGVAGARAAEAPVLAVPRVVHPGAGQIFYFVMTDRFANGEPRNDTGGIVGGPDEHGFDPMRISHYHGGDFRGLTDKLDYIRGLGATAIWVTPPFKNKPLQSGTAGYHGYWILDFETIDPHLGTDEEFAEFVGQAHARGLKVFLDVVVNHTADVIRFADGTEYIPKAVAPYRDASGAPFDEHLFAYDGGARAPAFPSLSAEKSFPRVPLVSPAEVHAKNPAWLNDVTLYHNRGNSSFRDENSLHGDFVGLDDTFTEHPRVVRGFIEIFRGWMTRHRIDGFRIDTVKHANLEFWKAFGPAIRAHARRLGRPDFFQFGEVADERRDVAFLSEFSTRGRLDATLDFGFFVAARDFISKGGPAGELATLFDQDDLYTDADSNAHGQTTFLGNHDSGRFAFFLQQDNPGASPATLLELTKLGHALLLLVRGQPVIYYGDEQGMTGFGHDMAAREPMFPAQAEAYRKLSLLGTTRTGVDDKFDARHPLYRTLAALAKLRAAHPALVRGAMLARPNDRPEVFAFSRVERAERVEYLIALNRARTESVSVSLTTSQPGGTRWQKLFDSLTPEHPPAPDEPRAMSDAQGRLLVALAPRQLAVWRAETPWPAPAAENLPSVRVFIPELAAVASSSGNSSTSSPELRFKTRVVDGHTLVVRQEIRAEVTGADGLGEVTFMLERAARPGVYELLGTDDAPPYRVFWSPSEDAAEDDEARVIATFDNLRGGKFSGASRFTRFSGFAKR